MAHMPAKPKPKPKPKTLHEIIAMILNTAPDKTASTNYIARQIAKQQLWANPKDGTFPDAFHIRLRVKSKRYRHLFDMPDDLTVRLKKP
jgi:hypothetical protein